MTTNVYARRDNPGEVSEIVVTARAEIAGWPNRFGGADHTNSMPTYIVQIDVNEDEYQNPQDLVTVWGAIREDIERLGGEIKSTYAVLGSFDFHLVFTVPDGETAFQVTQAIERHGLDTTSMRGLPLERIGELVDDI